MNTFRFKKIHIYIYIAHDIWISWSCMEYFTLVSLTLWGIFWLGFAQLNILRPEQNGCTLQTSFSCAFSWMKMSEIRLKFHWKMFTSVQFRIRPYWLEVMAWCHQATNLSVVACNTDRNVSTGLHVWSSVNTLWPRQNGRHFPDDILKWIFLNENVWISTKISFVPRGPINNIPALVQMMAWRRPGDKPLSGPMMV